MDRWTDLVKDRKSERKVPAGPRGDRALSEKDGSIIRSLPGIGNRHLEAEREGKVRVGTGRDKEAGSQTESRVGIKE
jgi:hypothetical protein